MFFSRLFNRQKAKETYLKNFIFGVEDSLVSTVGLLSGVTAASATRETIITTGLVLIVVEGVSMGIGSLLSQESTDEIVGHTSSDGLALKGALTMFASYIIAGFIPLSPYFLLPREIAMPVSVAVSLFGLFCLGLGTAAYFKRPNLMRRALRMLLLGGLAVMMGVVVGKIFHL